MVNQKETEYMEELFKYWEIENYERVSGYDGSDDDLSDILKGRYPEQMTSGEVGCTTSHLKAIKHWYETSDTPYAVIMEDDIDLDLNVGFLLGVTLSQRCHMIGM